jgi:hypothetical protein
MRFYIIRDADPHYFNENPYLASLSNADPDSRDRNPDIRNIIIFSFRFDSFALNC